MAHFIDDFRVRSQMAMWVSETGWNAITPDMVVEHATGLGIPDTTIAEVLRRMEAVSVMFHDEHAAAFAGAMRIIDPHGLTLDLDD